eukprot:jgi/Chlat1/4269/Chrsp29S04551
MRHLIDHGCPAAPPCRPTQRATLLQPLLLLFRNILRVSVSDAGGGGGGGVVCLAVDIPFVSACRAPACTIPLGVSVGGGESAAADLQEEEEAEQGQVGRYASAGGERVKDAGVGEAAATVVGASADAGSCGRVGATAVVGAGAVRVPSRRPSLAAVLPPPRLAHRSQSLSVPTLSPLRPVLWAKLVKWAEWGWCMEAAASVMGRPLLLHP